MLVRAKNSAYALLRVRPRSEAELASRLKDKGYVPGVITGVIEGLRKRGLVDDAKFARFWVDSRMHLKPVGDYILKRELKQKGVGESIVEAALRAKESEYDEYAVAKDMAV